MSSSNQEPPHKGGEGVRAVEYRNKQTGPWDWGGGQKNGGGLRQLLLCVIFILKLLPLCFIIIFASPPPLPPPPTGAFLGFANMKAGKAFFHSLDKDWGFSPGLQTWSGEDFPVVFL